MDDLWEAASGDHDRITREAALARADAELSGILPFLYQARSEEEFFHRLALAGESLAAVEARNGLEEGEMTETAARRYALYREALMEGQDSTVALDPLLQGGQYGSGPEQPLEHEEGPDFSHGYSEVPMGNLTGPDPQVTAPRQNGPGQVTQATGSLRRQADGSPSAAMTPSYMPPDLGTGSGSVDMGLPSAATGGQTPSIPAGMPGGPTAPVGTTASRDPVRSRVLRVTAMIARANPGLPRAECERLGRKVVSNYLRQADLNDSAISNGPMSGGGSGGGGESSGGGGTGFAGHALEWQGAKSLMKGMGGGGEAAGAAGEAAGAVGELGELAPLMAL